MSTAAGHTPLLKASEVAETFRVTVATVYKWRRDGVLQGVQVGDTVRFRREDVEALLTPNREESA